MCEICWSNPCDPRCPNAPEEPVAFLCSNCGGDIRHGDEYYEINDERWCYDCVSDAHRYAEVLED